LYATPEITLLLLASIRLLVSSWRLHLWPTCNTVDDQKLPTMDKESSPSSNKLDAMADLSKLIVMYDTTTSIDECLLLQAAFGVFWHWR
jgi:hypothetical protein